MKKITSICLILCLLLSNLCCVSFAVLEINPTLLQYEDFVYGAWKYNVNDYPAGFDLAYMNNAKNNSDTAKGFSSGWTLSNGTEIVAGKGWNLYTQDNHETYTLKSNKYGTSDIQRTVASEKQINLDAEGVIYNVSWEQYFAEGAMNTTNESVFLVFRKANGDTPAFKAGIKKPASTTARLNLVTEASGETWGTAGSALSAGTTYRILLQITTKPSGTNDTIKMKVYPADGIPSNGWDLTKSIDLSGNLDILMVDSSLNSAGSSTSSEVQLGNYWVEKLSESDAQHIKETEAFIAAIRGNLLASEDATDNVESAQLNLDNIAESKIKAELLNAFEKYEDLHSVAQLIVTAGETLSDADIDTAKNAVAEVTDEEFKSVFEASITEIEILKDGEAAAEESVAEAEAEPNAQNAAAAKDMVELLPEGDTKAALTERIAAVYVVIAETQASVESAEAAMEEVNALPSGSTKASLLNRVADVYVTIAQNNPTDENLDNAYEVVSSLPNGEEKNSLLTDLVEIKLELLEEEDVISRFEYDALLESVQNLPESSEKTALLERVAALESAVVVYSANPETLWYDDFNYHTSSQSEYSESTKLSEIATALQSDSKKGFSTGWTLSDGTAISGDKGWNVYTGDNHSTHQLMVTKFSANKIKRNVSENKQIDLDTENGIYNIGWEQYFDENALRTGNDNMFIILRAENSSTDEKELFQVGIKTTSNTLLTRLNFKCGEQNEVWGSADNALVGGKTYQIVIRIETNPSGTKDVIKMKAYPMGSLPAEAWDLTKEIDLSGKLDIVHLEIRNTNLEGSKDIRIGNLYAEKISGSEWEYIEETEALLASIKEKLLKINAADSDISSAQEKIDDIAASNIKNSLNEVLDKYEALNETVKLVAKAKETLSDTDIDAARNAAEAVAESEFKSVFEEGIDDAVTTKNSKQAAEDSVAAAEADKTAANIEAAQQKVNALPDGALKSALLKRLTVVWVDIAQSNPTEENLDEAFDAVSSLPDGEEKNSLLTDLVEIKVEILEGEESISRSDYDTLLESVQSLPESSKKAALLERLAALESAVAVYVVNPQLLWYEDFNYHTSSQSEYSESTKLGEITEALQSDSKKGFSTGWTLSDDTVIEGDKGWNVYTGDNHSTHQLMTTKIYASKIKRVVDEERRIDLDTENGIYNIIWEQYFDENALRTGNDKVFLIMRAENSSTDEKEIFQAGIKTTSNTLLTRLNLLCSDSPEQWGSTENALVGGKTYQIMMRIETNPAGTKDVIKMKAYPKGSLPAESWDLTKEIDLTGKLDILQLETANADSPTTSKDIRIGNLFAEKFSENEWGYIEETEALLKIIKEKLLSGETVESEINLIREKIQGIGGAGIGNQFNSLLENSKALNEVAKLVSKAKETLSDDDISAACNAVEGVEDALLKNTFETGVNDAVTLKNSKQEAELAIALAEVNPNAENAAAAQQKVDTLPEGTIKKQLTARLAMVWVIVAENDPTGENLTAALNSVSSLPESSEKQSLLTELLDIKVALLENESTPSKADYDAVIESINSLNEGAKRTEFSERMETVKSAVAITYAPYAVAAAEASKTEESVAHGREWVELLPDSDDKDSLIERLNNVEEGMRIRWIYDSFDYEANTPLSSITELNSANEERGFSTGWMTSNALTSPINSEKVKTDGNGFILFPGANSSTGMYRGLSRKIDLTQDDEYYLGCKIILPADAKTDTNRAVKLEIGVKGEESPLFMAGLIGNGRGYLTFFVKDNNRVDYTKRAFGVGKTYNLKMRITSGEDIADRIYAKLWEVGSEEPSEWMLTKATTIDTEIDLIDFNLNCAATYGFADLLVEKYEEGALTKLYAAESAVTTAISSKTEESAQAARTLVEKLPDSMARSDLYAKLRPVEELILKQKNIEVMLEGIENTVIDASNADSIYSTLESYAEDIKEVQEAEMAEYSERIEAVKAKIYKVQAERDIVSANEWKGNKELTENVDENAEQVERYTAISLVKSDNVNNYYLRFSVTPADSSAKINLGESIINLEGLTPDVLNTVVLSVNSVGVKKLVGVADKNGNIVFNESVQEIVIPQTEVFGITLKKGSSVSAVEVQKINSGYAQLLENELAALTPDSKLANIENAQKSADAFANGILKDLLQEEIKLATVNNKKIAPQIDILSISGINQVGQTLTASVSIVDEGGNFSSYKYEWKVSGRTVSAENTLKVQSSMAGKTVTLAVTPYSIHNLAGKEKTVSTKILPGGGSELGSSGGGSGGGGGGGISRPNSTETTSNSPSTQNGEIGKFVDLREHWAKADVEYMAEKGYVTGTSKDFFAPDDKITRAEFATLIARILGLSAETTNEFTDVNSASWYNGYIGAVLKAGVLSGYGNGLFKPDENVTREEMAKGIMNAYTYLGRSMETTELIQFTDAAEISPWASGYVKSCYKLGIMVGDDSGRFRPRANATRAEAAVVLKRLITSK